MTDTADSSLPADLRAARERPRALSPSSGTLRVEVDPNVTQVWRRSSGDHDTVPGPSSDFREKYTLGEELGRGGMGRVVLAFDRSLKRQVAMKILSTTEDNAQILRRFVEEAQISGQLEHPNLLPVHDVGMTDTGDFYFTMKYVRSHTTLRAVIDGLRGGDPQLHEYYTFARRVEVIQQLCGALAHAHECGVVHRDVKPENVMLDDLGEVYLLDWGIARLRHELEERSSVLQRSPGAGTDYLIGTPAYMAPEQARGDPIDGRADVYALVAVLYELLCLHHYLEPQVPSLARQAADRPEGQVRAAPTEADDTRQPARSGELEQILSAVCDAHPPDAESYFDRLNGRTPRILSRIGRQGLDRELSKRFQSAQDLEGALRAWQMGCGPVVCPGTAIQRSMSGYGRWIDRHPLVIPLLTYAGLGLFLGSYALFCWSYFAR